MKKCGDSIKLVEPPHTLTYNEARDGLVMQEYPDEKDIENGNAG